MYSLVLNTKSKALEVVHSGDCLCSEYPNPLSYRRLQYLTEVQSKSYFLNCASDLAPFLIYNGLMHRH